MTLRTEQRQKDKEGKETKEKDQGRKRKFKETRFKLFNLQVR